MQQKTHSLLSLRIFIGTAALFIATTAQAQTAHQARPGSDLVSGSASKLVEQVSGTSFGLITDSFERATLTISGPNGYRAVKDFHATEGVAIDLLTNGWRVIEKEVDEQIVRLEDGRYRYELATVDSSGKASKSAGTFMATGGAAMSRDLFRSGLSEIRQQLAETPNTEDSGLQTKVSAVYRADTYVAIDDTGVSFGTSLFLDSDTPIAGEWWDINNTDGDLDVREWPSLDTRIFVDRSNNHLGLGTTTPSGSLHITDDSLPELVLQQTGSTRWEMQASSNELLFYDGAYARMFTIENGGRNDQLVLDSGGNIGIGTPDPSATLEIEDTAGTAQFLIDQQGADASVEVMFNLVCNCAPAFRMQNSNNGKVWFFRHTAGGDFSFDDPGSGGLEMLLTSSGNLTIKGSLSQGSSRALKENLERPDAGSILSTLDELDLYEWSYKDASARHLGPMAEDFAEAFGLGEQRTRLAPADVAGVALAATKALRGENLELRESNDSLKLSNLDLQRSNQSLMEQLRLLAQRVTQLENN